MAGHQRQWVCKPRAVIASLAAVPLYEVRSRDLKIRLLAEDAEVISE